MMSKLEIAAKIKNAIEEKLCLLGAYVDKELPEYIIVMIANKKSKESMAKDLQLFLGSETNNFIEWLHELLEKHHSHSDENCGNKSEKPLKGKSVDSPDKKKKVEKEKQKLKSKSRKNDEKKDHKKSSNNKPSKTRSRSRSPKSDLNRSVEAKKSKLKLTPDKIANKSSNKRDNIKVITEKVIVKDPEWLMDCRRESNIKDTLVSSEPKIITSLPSVVKTTERSVAKKEFFKSSLEMVQRDLKEAAADITSKSEVDAEKQTQRSSVFSRLGTNAVDLRRTKLNKDADSNQIRPKSPLKRSIQKFSDGADEDSISQSKIKRTDNHSSPPKFIVTLKGAEKLNVPLTSRLGPKISQELLDSIDEDSIDIEVHDSISDIAQDSKENSDLNTETQSTRCKFWPTCKNKETCPFLHPSEPCKIFPNCKFGAQCMFIHPNCRFSNNCSKPDCPYTHYGPRIAVVAVKPVAPHTLPRCAYYPNCHNVNCKFFHPNLPCRFGISCKMKSSCMFYHPSIPTIAELKWTASRVDQASPVIIDTTSSKKSEIESV